MSGLFRSADTWEEISNSDDGSDDDDEQESEERDRERVDVETLERLFARLRASLRV
ncbi:hypothetical protein NEOLEDRAFT_1130309 [Neolentinus lepideus HHB14362 ss-1]|uniref:Uncharacterized protein n=1 Tax=Neolentinus lepideus HHB14362 ss-1 TaxID=1314782 RepID=A0A165U974_9AGAM|nr:hypothetical protein NEOLEDRAFT_1130309 [Neolentinus lepideus HHB14362 ss-1]